MFNRWLRYIPVAEMIARTSDSPILEAGCGPKGLAKYLTDRPIVGVEIDAELLKAYKEPNFTPVVGSAEALPFGDGSFPAVVFIDALEHVPRSGREKAIRELLRVSSSKLYLGAPLRENCEKAQEVLAGLYRFFRKPAPVWLTEHMDYSKGGLPTEAEIRQILDGIEGIRYRAVPSENVFIYVAAIFFDDFIFSQERITYIMSVDRWDFSKHRFIENLVRVTLTPFRKLPLFLNFGTTVRRIFVIEKTGAAGGRDVND